MMKIISLIIDENWQAYEAFTINKNEFSAIFKIKYIE